MFFEGAKAPRHAENAADGPKISPMADQAPGTFEQKVKRLEDIVKELENGNVDLDRAVQLFKEGKGLSAECESLLKSAQAQIDRAMEQPAAAPPADDTEIPF